jgi:hypothetical protein
MKILLALVVSLFAGNLSASNIDLNTFIPLINTDFRESKFQNSLNPLNSRFEIEKVDAANSIFYLYKFKKDGFMLNVANNKLLSIVLYREAEKGYRQFNGKMPLKINFTMNRGQIEKIIGPPLECIAAQTVNTVKIDLNCIYPYTNTVNFRVTYDSVDSLDYQTKPLTMIFASSINKAFN